MENVRKVERAATDESAPVTQTFPPVQSDEQIVPIINTLVHDQPGIYQVNIPNTGTILPGFPEDLVVECEAIVSAAGIRGTVVPPLPTTDAGGHDPALAAGRDGGGGAAHA